MTHGMEQQAGWMITGFQATIALWVWVAVALVYGFWRSLGDADQDPVRPAGPLD